jgi:DNA topoisomerase-3
MARTLYITEKASVARALAGVLGGQRVRGETHIQCGDDVVAWASGHLLRLFEPEEYDANLKIWSLEALPIVPERWKYKPVERTKALLEGLGKLLKEADSVVHAGDADREGQSLVDEILEHFGWNGPTKRLRINDVNPDAIRKALKEMRDNGDYRGESLAARARSYADYMAGVNLTRWCTKHADMSGYEFEGAGAGSGSGKVFSVGRVQTPTLGLVVRRDREIESFVPRPYFVLSAALELSEGRKIIGRWQPDETLSETELPETREACKPFCDRISADGRGEVTKADKKIHRKSPPLPYSLPQLQMDASRLYDITDALKHVQKLYELACVSYPRTDCPYIPEGHHAQARSVLDAAASACPELRELLNTADTARKGPAWDSSRVLEHHAIIPTVKAPAAEALSEAERKIYGLITRRYAIQFLPDHEYEETTVEFMAGNERFRVSGRTVLIPGWTRWDGNREEAKDDFSPPSLPSVSVGETGYVEPVVEEKKTTTPKRFTYDTLLGAMNGIHIYVQDPEIRKRLKELDGIGTAATQENILALLFDRGYIEKKKKQVFSTPTGRVLIDLLNAGGKSMAFAVPDLTALWEQKITQIEKGELSLETFVSEVAGMVEEIVREPLRVPEITGFPRKKKCLMEDCGGYLNRKTGTYGPFYACPICKHVFRERDGEPVAAGSVEIVQADCPMNCGRKARRFEGKYGPFWKCSCSPGMFLKDIDGKPAVSEKHKNTAQ